MKFNVFEYHLKIEYVGPIFGVCSRIKFLLKQILQTILNKNNHRFIIYHEFKEYPETVSPQLRWEMSIDEKYR